MSLIWSTRLKSVGVGILFEFVIRADFSSWRCLKSYYSKIAMTHVRCHQQEHLPIVKDTATPDRKDIRISDTPFLLQHFLLGY